MLTGYGHKENRRALSRLLIDVKRSPCPEPGCPGELTWEPPYPAEPDTGTRAWRGGVSCDCCSYIREDEPRDEDAGREAA